MTTSAEHNAAFPLLRTQLPAREAGEVIAGRYRIVRKLGAGGMGEVFEVAHTELPRRFALKTLQAHYATQEEALRRFRSEAEVGALLESPHLVSVFDCQFGGKIPFFVMELLEGEDVRSLLLRHAGSVGIAKAVRIASGAAAGLRVAHRNGVVHRDLKPANLFLSTQFGEEVCKVLDFGVAKLGSTADCPLPPVTSVMGKLVGTLAYMAPEQIRADRPVDGRADVYSLGAILYEMISGRRPFEAGSDHELMYKVLHEEAEPLEKVASCPAPVAALVRASMSKEPDDRPSMEQLHDALELMGRSRESLGSDHGTSHVTAPQLPLRVVSTRRGRRGRTTGAVVAFVLCVASLLAVTVYRSFAGNAAPAVVTAPMQAGEGRETVAIASRNLTPAMQEQSFRTTSADDTAEVRAAPAEPQLSPSARGVPSRPPATGAAPAGGSLRFERQNPYLR